MAIQYIGSATGVSSATLPSHQAGDLILAFAFRDGSTTAPSLPASGWTNIANNGANTCSGRIAYRIATAPGTASGTWNNATSVVFMVYRNIDQTTPIGNTNTNTGSSTTVNYPALSVSSGSWVVGFAGHRSANVNLVAPSGMTNRAYVQDATDEAAGHDTNGAVSSWSSTNTSVGGTFSGWRSYVVEINLGSISATATVTPTQATSAVSSISVQVIENRIANVSAVQSQSFAGLFLQDSQDWYAWFFERSDLIISEGGAVSNVQTLEANSEIKNVTASATVDGLVLIGGIETNSSLGNLDLSGFAITNTLDAQVQSFVEFIFALANGNAEVSAIENVSEVENVGFIADSSIETTTLEVNSQVEQISGLANANVESGFADAISTAESTNALGSSIIEPVPVEAMSAVGVISVIVDTSALVSIVGIETQSSVESINADANALVLSNTLEAQSGVSSVTASGGQVQNATAQVNEVQGLVALGKVKAIGDKVRPIGGQTLIRPVQDRDAIAKVKPLLAVALVKKIKAKEITVQNGTAKIIPIESAALFSDIQATGVLDISEDEILLLLAA